MSAKQIEKPRDDKETKPDQDAKPTREAKQKHADYLRAKGVSEAEAKRIAKVDDTEAKPVDIVASMVAYCRGLPKRKDK